MTMIPQKAMNLQSSKIFYWITFVLTIFILLMNVGIGLMALGVVIVPLLILHFINGRHFDKIANHRMAMVLSSANFLLFALIRPDGGHTLNDNGLSLLLEIFGMYWGYDRAYEDYYAFGSLALLVVQAIMDIRLKTIIKKRKGIGAET